MIKRLIRLTRRGVEIFGWIGLVSLIFKTQLEDMIRKANEAAARKKVEREDGLYTES